MMNSNSPRIPRLLRLSDVLEITCLSKSSIYKYINAGTFPKSIFLGERSVAWISSEVYQWIDDRVKQRDQMVA